MCRPFGLSAPPGFAGGYEFQPVDPDRFAARLRALLDGFSIHVAIGLRGADRVQVMGRVREFLDGSLLADS